MRVFKISVPVLISGLISLLLLKSDFLNFIIWWLAILLMGLIFMPLTGRVFSGFSDKGYLFSKVIGIAIPAYGLWLLSSLRLIPFDRVWIVIIYAVAALLLWVARKGYKNFLDIFGNPKTVNFLVIEESMFLLCLSVWTFIRGLRPEISGYGGLEKFMDFGFVNSILDTKFMPPADIWFAGKSINYYYFGQYISAFITKLTNISSAITYNLMMATLFAFAFVLAFSLVYHITIRWKKEWSKKAVAAGLIAAFLLALGGNLHTIMFTTVFPAAKNAGILSPNIEVRDNYWFPDATRYIGHNPNTVPPNEDKTIHEFPVYSFIVSDLHAHVINLPFVLTVIALIFVFLYGMLERIKKNEEILSWKKIPPELILIAFFIGIFHMSNYWDFPIYTMVAGTAILYIGLAKYQYSVRALLYTAKMGLLIIIISTILALPFSMNLTSLTNGIGITHTKSALYQLLILWGYQLFLALYFMAFALFRERRYIRQTISQKSGKAKKSANQTGKVDSGKELLHRILQLTPSDAFILILSLSAIGLVIMPEIIYVKDIYGGGYYRSNTMFKLTYQAFMMFAIAAGYIVYRIFSVKRSGLKNGILGIAVGLAVILPMLYPFYAIPGWYGEITVDNYKGLDGVRTYFAKNLPDDLKAIEWLKEHEKGQPVILEAFGDSYTDYGRVSAVTGFPTVMGWGTHEWLWRNDNTVCDQRRSEVTTVYESDDLNATKSILDKYQVQYIVIGRFEREKFRNLKEGKLLGLGSVLYENPGIKIIKVRQGV